MNSTAPARREPRESRRAPARERTFARAVVAWFRRHRRDLPWRRTRDPYAIWISEAMLQQTRVSVVLPYYDRFLARYPTIADLARAPLDDVLGAWAGLGYYRRARQIKAAAEQIVRDHGGRLPDTPEALQALPGIGPYTSGAILSIAFDRPAPIVDGNVARVLSRVHAFAGGPGDCDWETRLWELARALVPAHEPGAFNQGLMELGATVCLPRVPACGRCPVRQHCHAYASGSPERYPAARARPRVQRIELWALVLEHGGRYLLRRRQENELSAGFWEFPTFARPRGLRAEAFFADVLAGILDPARLRTLRSGLQFDRGPVVQHGVLARDLRLRIYRGRFPEGRAIVGLRSSRASRAPQPRRRPPQGWAWVRPADFAARPFATAARKVARALALG